MAAVAAVAEVAEVAVLLLGAVRAEMRVSESLDVSTMDRTEHSTLHAV